MSVKGVEVPEKVDGFFRLRGRNFQKWETNFWTIFWQFFSLEFPQFRAHLGTNKKNPPQSSQPHLCRIRGVSEAGFPSTTHGSEAGTHQHLIKQLAQNLASNGEVPSLDGLCPLSLQADGSRFEGNACSKQNRNNIVFCGSLQFCWFKSRAYAGDSLWKVTGPKNIAETTHR